MAGRRFTFNQTHLTSLPNTVRNQHVRRRTINFYQVPDTTTHDGRGRVANHPNSLSVSQPLGGERLGRFCIHDGDQVRHYRDGASVVPGDEVLILDIHPEFRLCSPGAADQSRTPVPAVTGLVNHVHDPAVEQLARESPGLRYVEEFEQTNHWIGLRIPGAPNAAADLKRMGDRIVNG